MKFEIEQLLKDAYSKKEAPSVMLNQTLIHEMKECGTMNQERGKHHFRKWFATAAAIVCIVTAGITVTNAVTDGAVLKAVEDFVYVVIDDGKKTRYNVYRNEDGSYILKSGDKDSVDALEEYVETIDEYGDSKDSSIYAESVEMDGEDSRTAKYYKSKEGDAMSSFSHQYKETKQKIVFLDDFPKYYTEEDKVWSARSIMVNYNLSCSCEEERRVYQRELQRFVECTNLTYIKKAYEKAKEDFQSGQDYLISEYCEGDTVSWLRIPCSTLDFHNDIATATADSAAGRQCTCKVTIKKSKSGYTVTVEKVKTE